MNSKIKTILILVAVAIVLILVYMFFIKKPVDVPNLTTSDGATLPNTTDIANPETAALNKDFLSTLLNVKSIKLDDSIFSEKSFMSLRDSTILLTPDGTEGRHNPFAPIGSDLVASPVSNTGIDNLQIIGTDVGSTTTQDLNIIIPTNPTTTNPSVTPPKI